MQPLSFIEIINRGAIATYPLIVMSILSVAVILERLWSLRDAGGASEQMADSLLDSVKQGRKDLALALCRQNQRFAAARLFLAALTHGDGANLERATAFMNEAIFAEGQRLKKNLWILGTVASSAPFIGLLGTVVGIIKSFESMAVAGTGGFAVVAAGISEALVATALGLAVAIIAVIFYNYFQTRIATLNALFRIQVAKVLQSFTTA